VDGHSVKINSLASLMGKGFTDWIVHFGCCETIDMSELPRSRAVGHQNPNKDHTSTHEAFCNVIPRQQPRNLDSVPVHDVKISRSASK